MLNKTGYLHIKNHFEEMHDKAISVKANKLALKNDCHIISYSYTSSVPSKILNHRNTLKQPYIDDLRTTPPDFSC